MNDVRTERIGCTAGEFDQEVNHALGCCSRHERVNTAGVTLRCLAREFVAAGRPRDSDRVKGCRFNEHGGCRWVDLGRCATHHTGNTNRAGIVGDEQVFNAQSSFDFVESRDLFARLRPPNGDSARELVEVVTVGGLTHFHHDVVGNVDWKRNGPYAHQRQALDHPLRRRCRGVDSTHYPSNKARAANGSANRCGVVNRDREAFCCGDGDGERRVSECCPRGVGVFARDTAD